MLPLFGLGIVPHKNNPFGPQFSVECLWKLNRRFGWSTDLHNMILLTFLKQMFQLFLFIISHAKGCSVRVIWELHSLSQSSDPYEKYGLEILFFYDFKIGLCESLILFVKPLDIALHWEKYFCWLPCATVQCSCNYFQGKSSEFHKWTKRTNQRKNMLISPRMRL